MPRLTPFRRWLPRDVYFWLKAILLALIAITAARLLTVLITPVGPYGDWRPAPPRLLSPEAQAAILAAVDPFFRPGAMQEAAADTGASTDLTLFGVRGGAGAIPGSAIIGPSDTEQKSYMVGEEVAPGIILSEVHFDHVVLKSGNSSITLYMEGAEPIPGETEVPAGTAAAAEAAVAAFDFKPRTRGGKVTGILIAPGANPALFNASGFRQGDVVVAVNGARIGSMIDVQQLQSSIAPGARLVLTVERGGKTVPIALNVPGNS
jgi:general secretion pathway protein C